MTQDNNQQELMLKLSLFEQQIRQLHEQLQAVEQGIIEMSSLNLGLDELKGAKDKEILAPIGRGIFAKAKLLSEELTVDVGNKNLVKKSISATQETIQEQIIKLKNVKKELKENLERLNQEVTKVFMYAQKKSEKK